MSERSASLAGAKPGQRIVPRGAPRSAIGHSAEVRPSNRLLNSDIRRWHAGVSDSYRNHVSTIASGLAGKNNALNFVRLALATLVIFAHSSLSGRGALPNLGNVGLGEFAVAGFFTISGYLIAASRMRLGWLPFLWRRFLRIFPAYWVSLLVVAFGMAPIASATFRTGTWHAVDASQFVINNAGLLLNQASIGHTLGPHLFPYWNGSLWTLGYEFAAYIGAGFLLSLGFARSRPVPLIAAALAGFTALHALALGPLNITGATYVQSLQLGSFFLAGMLLWALRDRVSVSWQPAGLCVVVLSVTVISGTWDVLGPLPMAYLCLWLGARLPLRIGTENDISYGMYIFAFPVEQVLAMAHFHAGGLIGFSCVATFLTVPLAIASWRFVERPSMQLGRLVPAQRRRAAHVMPDDVRVTVAATS